MWASFERCVPDWQGYSGNPHLCQLHASEARERTFNDGMQLLPGNYCFKLNAGLRAQLPFNSCLKLYVLT